MSTAGTEIPFNHADVESAENQKLFAEAYASESKKETQIAHVVTEEVKVPEVITPEPVIATKPLVETPVVIPDTTKAEPVVVKTYDVPDWAKDLPDTVKEKLQEEIQQKLFYEHRLKSEAGRQSALQKKLFDARRETERLRNHVAPPQDPALAAAAKQDAEKQLAEWNALEVADTNLAKAVDQKQQMGLAQLREELKREINATVNPLNQHIEQGYVEEQRRLLSEAVPNYAEVINSPVYKRWFDNDASPGIRQLASTSSDYNDAITVLRMYSQEAPRIYNDMVRAGELPAPPQTQPQAVQPTTTVQTVDTTHADAVAKAREERIKAAPVVQNTPNPVSPPTTTPFANNRPGGSVDVEDLAVRALFEEAFKKNQRSR